MVYICSNNLCSVVKSQNNFWNYLINISKLIFDTLKNNLSVEILWKYLTTWHLNTALSFIPNEWYSPVTLPYFHLLLTLISENLNFFLTVHSWIQALEIGEFFITRCLVYFRNISFLRSAVMLQFDWPICCCW